MLEEFTPHLMYYFGNYYLQRGKIPFVHQNSGINTAYMFLGSDSIVPSNSTFEESEIPDKNCDNSNGFIFEQMVSKHGAYCYNCSVIV